MVVGLDLAVQRSYELPDAAQLRSWGQHDRQVTKILQIERRLHRCINARRDSLLDFPGTEAEGHPASTDVGSDARHSYGTRSVPTLQSHWRDRAFTNCSDECDQEFSSLQTRTRERLGDRFGNPHWELNRHSSVTDVRDTEDRDAASHVRPRLNDAVGKPSRFCQY